MTIATRRRARTSHRVTTTRVRAWCVNCGLMRKVVPGATGVGFIAPHSSTRFTACPGSGAAVVPDPDPLAHGILHADACRGAGGFSCSCPLGQKGPTDDGR